MILECRSSCDVDDGRLREQPKRTVPRYLSTGPPGGLRSIDHSNWSWEGPNPRTIDKVVEILSSARTKLAEKEEAND